MFSCGCGSSLPTAVSHGARPRSCWRRNGSTRTWRCRTRTISISCGWRCGSRADAYIDGKARTRVRPFRRPLCRADRGRRQPRSQSAGRQLWSGAVDRAILDALSLSLGCSFYEGDARQPRRYRSGVARQPRKRPGRLRHAAFLALLTPAASVAARHTVGLVDVIGGHPGQVGDGLPDRSRKSSLPTATAISSSRSGAISMPIWPG